MEFFFLMEKLRGSPIVTHAPPLTIATPERSFSGSVAIYYAFRNLSGTEIVLQRLAKAFASRGCKVWLVADDRNCRLLPDLPSSIELIYVNTSSTGRAVLPLSRFLREQRPDVALSAYPLNNLSLFLAGRLAKVPTRLVLTEHITMDCQFQAYPPARRRILAWLLPRVYRRVDAVVAVSSGVRDSLRWIGIPDRRVHVLPNPANVVDFETSRLQPVDHPWFYDQSRPIIISVARLYLDKDLPMLIRAFARMRHDTRARLVIVGEGPEEAALKALVDQLKLTEDVWFTGFRPDPCALISKSRVLALSSIREGSPLALVEALTCGCPIVATRTTGAIDVLEDGRYGQLIPIGDDEAMASALVAVLNQCHDPGPGRVRAAMFSMERSTNAYLALFTDLS